jgi:hypothetical protein
MSEGNKANELGNDFSDHRRGSGSEVLRKPFHDLNRTEKQVLLLNNCVYLERFALDVAMKGCVVSILMAGIGLAARPIGGLPNAHHKPIIPITCESLFVI